MTGQKERKFGGSGPPEYRSCVGGGGCARGLGGWGGGGGGVGWGGGGR